VEKMKELFGSKMIDHSIVILTRVDDLRRDGMTLLQYKENSPPELQELIDLCGSRCFAVDNTVELDSKASKHALDGLIERVELMCEEQAKNEEETFYVIDDVEEAQEVLQEAKRHVEVVVQEQTRQEEKQLLGNLTNKLNRLHDKHKDIVRLQEVRVSLFCLWRGPFDDYGAILKIVSCTFLIYSTKL
jgi:hypothetical protein